MAHKSKRESLAGTFFAGFLFLGMGVGFFTGHLVTGLFVGMGMGFLIMGVIRYMLPDDGAAQAVGVSEFEDDADAPDFDSYLFEDDSDD